jgi:hypothetical protein
MIRTATDSPALQYLIPMRQNNVPPSPLPTGASLIPTSPPIIATRGSSGHPLTITVVTEIIADDLIVVLLGRDEAEFSASEAEDFDRRGDKRGRRSRKRM